MTIHIEDLTFDVIIGLLDFEREKPQKIILNLQIDYRYDDNHFIDYADIVFLIQKELKKSRYSLLEDALLGIKTLVTTTYPTIRTLWIKIAKPTILPECSVAVSKHWVLH